MLKIGSVSVRGVIKNVPFFQVDWPSPIPPTQAHTACNLDSFARYRGICRKTFWRQYKYVYMCTWSNKARSVPRCLIDWLLYKTWAGGPRLSFFFGRTVLGLIEGPILETAFYLQVLFSRYKFRSSEKPENSLYLSTVLYQMYAELVQIFWLAEEHPQNQHFIIVKSGNFCLRICHEAPFDRNVWKMAQLVSGT